MSKAPAFQLYAADFLTDENVLVMELDEVGAYIKLMCFAWREGSVPDDVRMLARLVGGGVSRTRMAEIWATLRPLFATHEEVTEAVPGWSGDDAPDRVFHIRLEGYRVEIQALKARRSRAGKKGMKKRWAGKNPASQPQEPQQLDNSVTDLLITNDNPSAFSLQSSTSKQPTSTTSPVVETKGQAEEFSTSVERPIPNITDARLKDAHDKTLGLGRITSAPKRIQASKDFHAALQAMNRETLWDVIHGLAILRDRGECGLRPGTPYTIGITLPGRWGEKDEDGRKTGIVWIGEGDQRHLVHITEAARSAYREQQAREEAA